MKITEKALIGELEGFPIEVVEKMLEHQVQQGYPEDITVFQKYKEVGSASKGFSWSNTPEGSYFWINVIGAKDFALFFSKYPKAVYPRLMEVRSCNECPWHRRVVFQEKADGFIAWNHAETLEEAEEQTATTFWKQAREIPKVEIAPENKKTTVIKTTIGNNIIETEIPQLAVVSPNQGLEYITEIKIELK